MNRRAFLSGLAAFAATATLDPERLLWVPGRKTVVLPPITVFTGTGNRFLTLDEASRLMVEEFKRRWDDLAITDQMLRDSLLRLQRVTRLEQPIQPSVRIGGNPDGLL